MFEPLESRVLMSAACFAVIGDFGDGSPAEAAVAKLVNGWRPDLVVTTGDDNYPVGAAATIDSHIGKFYHNYIYPYHGAYGAGSADGVNHFFPSLGNHDWYTAGAKPYLNYFALPGNERYYTYTAGPVQFFCVDSDPHEPDLYYVDSGKSTANSPEARWLHSALAASTAAWKIVYCHQPPFSSGLTHGSSPWMQWPFAQWGASAVLSGHEHNYERIILGSLPYFVDGSGGAELYDKFGTPVTGSKVRDGQDHGAMLVNATRTSISFQYIATNGRVVDRYTLSKAPAVPAQLKAVAAAGRAVNLSWQASAARVMQFRIQRSTDGRTFATIATVGPATRSYQDKSLMAGTRYTYRVRALGATANSAVSVAVAVVARKVA